VARHRGKVEIANGGPQVKEKPGGAVDLEVAGSAAASRTLGAERAIPGHGDTSR